MVWIEKFVEVDSFGIVRIKSVFLFLKFCLIIIWSLLIWIDSKILCFLYFRVCGCEVSLIVMGFARKYDKRVAWCTALKDIIVTAYTKRSVKMVLSKQWQFLWMLYVSGRWDSCGFLTVLCCCPRLRFYSFSLQRSGAIDLGACVAPAVKSLCSWDKYRDWYFLYWNSSYIYFRGAWYSL